ncbi:synaptobrevin-domain-containing protein [Kockovaella imperatae]|uniref:Synaptobrevin-domain-containing protein n=1 Tax=Kockovaella imperatae TaxID=4999 RepID=A0A1Y1UA65_9TREE|nr:synaptobrevin-domain-containing protein [Kockovaella imperatae]ORX34923.1 synaptobrevin-domain-containing protein [Kockovaella imperatae]
MSEQPYDPYIPSGSRGPAENGSGGSNGAGGGGAQKQKIRAIQDQIDQSVSIMHDNITKVAERGERLDALQDKTDTLAVSAQGFRRGASRVRKQMWWKDTKMKILSPVGIGICVLVVIIVVPIVKAVTGNHKN